MMDASRILAVQAARRLDAEASAAAMAEVRDGDGGTIARMAARLGVSDRHLRRIFEAELGVSPLQYLQTRRLLLAKQLLADTRLPVTQVALASGFASVRRFNAAFATGYRMSPTRLRRGPERTHVKPQALIDDGGFDSVTMRLALQTRFRLHRPAGSDRRARHRRRRAGRRDDDPAHRAGGCLRCRCRLDRSGL